MTQIVDYFIHSVAYLKSLGKMNYLLFWTIVNIGCMRHYTTIILNSIRAFVTMCTSCRLYPAGQSDGWNHYLSRLFSCLFSILWQICQAARWATRLLLRLLPLARALCRRYGCVRKRYLFRRNALRFCQNVWDLTDACANDALRSVKVEKNLFRRTPFVMCTYLDMCIIS